MKTIKSKMNVVVFTGGKGWVDTSKIENFLKANTNLKNYDFAEDQAFFTNLSEKEVNELVEKINNENAILLKNDKELKSIHDYGKFDCFSWKNCEHL